jgi:hypothetical protein
MPTAPAAAQAMAGAPFNRNTSMKPGPTILVLALLAVVALLMHRISALEERMDGGVPKVPPGAPVPGAAPMVEVAPAMMRIQHLAHKLWFSGQAGNLELAKFYRHEVKEVMEEIANAEIVEKDVHISENMRTYGLRAIEALKVQLNTDSLNDFSEHYETLINTCNSCHATCGHPELRMKVPESNRYTDQVFAPIK